MFPIFFSFWFLTKKVLNIFFLLLAKRADNDNDGGEEHHHHTAHTNIRKEKKFTARRCLQQFVSGENLNAFFYLKFIKIHWNFY